MANPPDAVDRYLANRAAPKPTFGGIYSGRNTPGAGGGLGGAYQSGVDDNLQAPPPPTTTDWASTFWGSLGLPADVISQINGIFQKYPDPSQAYAIAQQTLRGTSWYQQTFPGIATGIKNGLFTDETGYRSYVNDMNVLFNQYYGRNVTSNEVSGYLGAGQNPSYVANLLQGAAIAQTEGPEAQYLSGAYSPGGQLTGQELRAYGNEKAGIDTQLGQLVAQRLQKAQATFQNLFSGKLATAGFSLGPQGVYSPTLAGAKERVTAAGTPELPA